MPIVERKSHNKTISIGVSACLVGQKVRYNGEHKRSSLVKTTLSKYFNMHPVCPEMGIGMGTPREPIRLVGEQNSDQISAVGSDNSDLDVTEKLQLFAQEQIPGLSEVSGYILMQRSPSCGMERVKVYHKNGNPLGKSSPGIYAGTLMKAMPLLPFEEEGRLHDPVLCENFITRVHAYKRWQSLCEKPIQHHDLQQFHACHKYLLMAHSQKHYSKLGQLVANADKVLIEELCEQYIALFMETLKLKANRKGHTNAMLHLVGYLKTELDTEEKNHLLTLIEDYRQSIVPLVVPMTALRHNLEKYGSTYVKEQVYLQPHPEDLGLRNTI